ncbi:MULTISPECIES: hypothetical protein [unclassified Corallococcus]|uniref:hypothetical protein n=1 Tax=unclassified Corallococcus TaxID=2685029 RepID=UPI001A8F6849|nr:MULTISPECIES: hypothetical protein [unclassified Corallococcus]MBN9685377.1 hypothetical protein [Corallococcus sp. NCSPR001]WAS83172.1 hypothetical protein O0N60_28105 [Corallococcus sp. NCRR]
MSPRAKSKLDEKGALFIALWRAGAVIRAEARHGLCEQLLGDEDMEGVRRQLHALAVVLDAVQHSGKTSLTDALRQVARDALDEDARALLVLLSDAAEASHAS